MPFDNYTSPPHRPSFGLGGDNPNFSKSMDKKLQKGRKRIFDVNRGGYINKTAGRPAPREMPKPKNYRKAPQPAKTNFDKGGNFNKSGFTENLKVMGTAAATAAIKYGYRKGTEVLTAYVDAAAQDLIMGVNRKLKRVTNPPGLTGRPDRTIPLFSEEKATPMRNQGTVEPKMMHKTKVITGNPSSKTLMEIGKENGIETRVLFDSKMWREPGEGTSSPLNRSVLSHSCGFNCRNFMTPGTAAFVTRGDFLRATMPLALGPIPDIGAGSASSWADGITYASLLETMTELQFHNQSRFLPLVMKIHIVTRRQGSESKLTQEPSAEMSSLVNLVGLDDQGDYRNPPRTGIPGYYLLSTPRGEGSGYEFGGTFYEFDMLNSGRGLMSSPYFRDNFSIVDTLTKTLEPNDFWQFRHEHQFGSGVDLDIMTADYQGVSDDDPLKTADLTPLSYFYVIETKGLPCEGVYNQGNNGADLFEPRFGTSPGYYYMEIRKSIKFVRPSENSFEIIPGVGQFGGPVERRIHTRTFTKNEVDFANNPRERKPFYRLPADVGTGNNLAIGSFFIPLEIETTRSLAGAGTKSGQADNDPATR